MACRIMWHVPFCIIYTQNSNKRLLVFILIFFSNSLYRLIMSLFQVFWMENYEIITEYISLNQKRRKKKRHKRKKKTYYGDTSSPHVQVLWSSCFNWYWSENIVWPSPSLVNDYLSISFSIIIVLCIARAKNVLYSAVESLDIYGIFFYMHFSVHQIWDSYLHCWSVSTILLPATDLK